MIPTTPCDLDYRLPSRELWLPGREELSSDEGFGGYRNTWVIDRVGVREAKQVIKDEVDVVEAINTLAVSNDEFDTLATAVEYCDPESLVETDITIPMDSELNKFLEDDVSPTGGLDLGVAGLVNALAVIGCYPMVSCRGTPHAWSDTPLVRFAARLWRAQMLLPIANETRCGLVEEGGTLIAWSSSITQMMEMAQLVMDNRVEFARNPSNPVRHRSPRTSHSFQWGSVASYDKFEVAWTLGKPRRTYSRRRHVVAPLVKNEWRRK